MSDVANVLRYLGRVLPLSGDGPPPVDPEALAVAHGRRRREAPKGDLGVYAQLFSPEVGPGEEGFMPSDGAKETLLNLLSAKESAGPFRLALQLIKDSLAVLSHTGELLAPQPLMVRGSALHGVSSRNSHTFSQPMPPYQAAVGLEAEGEGLFGLTLTLDEGGIDVPLRATLWEGKRRRAVQSGDGAIHISGLNPGEYRLEIAARGASVGDIELVVEGEGSSG